MGNDAYAYRKGIMTDTIIQFLTPRRRKFFRIIDSINRDLLRNNDCGGNNRAGKRAVPPRGKWRAAETPGRARGPPPASSTPAMCRIPLCHNSFSKSILTMYDFRF